MESIAEQVIVDFYSADAPESLDETTATLILDISIKEHITIIVVADSALFVLVEIAHWHMVNLFCVQPKLLELGDVGDGIVEDRERIPQHPHVLVREPTRADRLLHLKRYIQTRKPLEKLRANHEVWHIAITVVRHFKDDFRRYRNPAQRRLYLQRHVMAVPCGKDYCSAFLAAKVELGCPHSRRCPNGGGHHGLIRYRLFGGLPRNWGGSFVSRGGFYGGRLAR